jgi:UDP-2,4-diacetamido-2,4,6-trideoxy-beta-L-altropyranose hydrolase
MKINYFIRKAEKKDVHLIFDLSNDPLVRENSINSKKILWKEHLNWFEKKNNDSNYVFYVVFDDKGKFIGQIRYEINNNIAAVNISITKNFIGKKLSVPLLNDTARTLFKENENMNEIHALIKPDNIPSIKSFQKAHYCFSKITEINSEIFSVYIFNRKKNKNE